MLRFFNSAVFTLCMLLVFNVPVQALNVVVSIRPLHSLVAAVMAGTGTPGLIIRTGISPHDYALKPSDAKRLEKSQIVFWMGPGMENFLVAPLQTLAPSARSIAFLQMPGLLGLTPRDVPIRADSETFALAMAQPDTVNPDPHAWMDPENARRMLIHIAQVVAQADPQRAEIYQRNAQRTARRLETLETELQHVLQPLKNIPYIVYHDAYLYFERRFGLTPAAVVSTNPELPVGAGRVRKLLGLIRSHNIRCVFTEPQFNPRLLDVLVESPDIHSAILDPLGTNIEPGPNLYAQLLRDTANALHTCLTR